MLVASSASYRYVPQLKSLVASREKDSRSAGNLKQSILVLLALGLSHSVIAQDSMVSSLRESDPGPPVHRFFDKTNIALQSINVMSQTAALMAIQAHDNGQKMAPCTRTCVGALEARGRTLDPFEKHFESYGYTWGTLYRIGGGVGLTLLTTYMLHSAGHYKLERWTPIIALAHANASLGYALHGSRQGNHGW